MINYILYSGFLYLLYIAFTKEVDDIFSDGINKNTISTQFGDGYGKFIYPNRYCDKDSNTEKIKKLTDLIEYDENLPKWRRCLLIATLITIILSIIMHRKLLPFPDFFKYILIIFFITYFSFNYYSYHYNKYAIDNIKIYIDKFKKNKDEL